MRKKNAPAVKAGVFFLYSRVMHGGKLNLPLL